jgi:hypothetical protein
VIGTTRSTVGFLFRAFRVNAGELSKYPTDDRGQKDHRTGQQEFFYSKQRRVEQPVCEVDGADRIWRTAISTTGRR